MADRPRLNSVISALETGGPAFLTFTNVDVESAYAMSDSSYDGVVFEMEHSPWDGGALRDSLQALLSRRRIAHSGSLSAMPTPLVRAPANGIEQTQFFAKQALDLGAYGVVFPHVSTAEQAYHAVTACRYPYPAATGREKPNGQRGFGPGRATRYWGLSDMVEYYERAGTWPHDPNGEVLVVIMIEDPTGIANLQEMLRDVPGIGTVLIGVGDLSIELGHPAAYRHPEVVAAIHEIVGICNAAGVPVGHPVVPVDEISRFLDEGYRFLMLAPRLSFEALEEGLRLSGRMPAR